VLLGIRHHYDNPLVVVVSLTGETSAEGDDEFDCLVDVIDGDVEMDAHLTQLGLRDRLEYQPRLRVATLTEIDPTMLGRARFST
jgi:hypothetical protein